MTLSVTPVVYGQISSTNIEETVGDLINSSVLSGLTATAGTGLTINIASGAALIEGHYVSDTGSTVTVPASTSSKLWLQLVRNSTGKVTSAQYVVSSSQISDSIQICSFTTTESGISGSPTNTTVVGLWLNNIDQLAFSSGNQTGSYNGPVTTGIFGPYTVLVQPATSVSGKSQPMVVDNQGNTLVNSSGVTQFSYLNNSTTNGSTTTTAGIMEALQYIVHWSPGGIPQGWLALAAGSYNLTKTVTIPTGARGLYISGAGYGNSNSEGGTVITGGSSSMQGLFSFGNTASDNTANSVRGCYIGNLAFDSSASFKSNANGIVTPCDFYNAADGAAKNNVFENIAFLAGGNVCVDVSQNDDSAFYNFITGAGSGSGIYVNGTTGTYRFQECRWFNGGTFAAKLMNLHNCIFTGPVTIGDSTTPVGAIMSFTGHMYWNKNSSGSLITNNASSSVVWSMTVDCFHAGIGAVPASGNGTLTGGGYILSGAVVNWNNLAGSAVSLFDSDDSVSMLFTTDVTVSGGAAINEIGGTGTYAKGQWVKYSG